MASSPKFLPLFFLFTTLIFSLQTHARDSQFFSKVTRHHDYHPTTTTTTTNDLKENEFSTLTKQQDQEEEESIFIPQTTGTGYGLYGHETGLHPPTTTTASATTEKNYATELKGLSEYRNYKKNYVDERNSNYYYGDAGYNGGVEKQGMSDTRFLENGKYFHDVNTEKNNYGANYMPYTNNYNNHYRSNYKNNNGYYGNYGENNYEEFYNNGNAMQGKQYQNQLPEEEEFDFDP